ncbi:ComEC/Rec2 family competence protein [Bizionia myxarmorum]|uniref:ComEC family competence protein n=1 Tax=Bizionia myxarmorum TaxID=291186 RepID=A0A5D0RC02_9FLAO|nr:ComEC/Rec2 family competence protein [Bizionia myxarmorum]TYB79200.1 ComEC family competence protein [Bizionia myxarmorum]
MLGILVSLHLAWSLALSVLLTGILLLALLVLYFYNRNQFKQHIWFGLVAYVTIISLGNLTVITHNHLHKESHYTHHYDISEAQISQFQISISEVLKPNAYNRKYIANLQSINGKPVSGKVLLNSSRIDSISRYAVDDKLIVYGKLQELSRPLNPYQFDYKKYLENHHIYAQIYSNPGAISVLSTNKHSIYGYADYVRQTLNQKLKKYEFEPSELAVINALLLGQRQDIDASLYTDYVNAGAIHILAISGLHIGIILLILQGLLKPLVFAKNGHYIKAIIILIILWTYAVIAGLSPSILRAVTMFSVITVGMYLKRPYNIYNTLAISAFVLLICNPMLLFEVGFQLSYLAVIGIVAIHPLLYNKLKTRFWLPNKIISLICLSLAAQLGVFPLSIFYFHQFPGLFLLTNVVIIPLLGLILGYGLIVFLFAALDIPKSLFTDGFGEVISTMNQFFKWIGQQEAFIFRDIPSNWFLVIGFYLITLLVTQYFISKSYSRLVVALSCICLFQIGLFFTNYWYHSQNEMLVLHKSKHSIIANKQGYNLSIFHNLDTLNTISDYSISNYKVGNFIKEVRYKNLPNSYTYNNQQFLVIDSLGIYKNLTFQPDYVILSQSPKINLNRLIDSLNPKVIIADGSNYKSYIKRWAETCINRKRPFHFTGEKGAFILK